MHNIIMVATVAKYQYYNIYIIIIYIYIYLVCRTLLGPLSVATLVLLLSYSLTIDIYTSHHPPLLHYNDIHCKGRLIFK